ncbi:porin [Testudinibacter sp. P80/BLE/0925]
MKKTLVALAVAAVAATSANAAVVYDQDGSKVEVGGSLRLLLNKETDRKVDLKNAGSRLVVKGSQDLGSGLSALANVELRFEEKTDAKDDSSFGNVTTKTLYAGFKQDGVGTLTFGRQLTNGDDVQLGDYAYEYGGNNNVTGASNKSVKFRSDSFSGFSFGLDYLFGNAAKGNTGNTKNGYGAALFYTAGLAEGTTLNLNAGYTQDRLSTEKTSKTDSWRLAGELLVSDFGVAYNYGQTRATENGEKQDKTTYHLVGLKYKLAAPSTVYGQWKRESEGSDRVHTYLVGADYKLHKNVITFVEYANVRTKVEGEDNKKENKVAVGLRVFF